MFLDHRFPFYGGFVQIFSNVVGDVKDIRQIKHLFGPGENVHADSRTAP